MMSSMFSVGESLHVDLSKELTVLSKTLFLFLSSVSGESNLL